MRDMAKPSNVRFVGRMKDILKYSVLVLCLGAIALGSTACGEETLTDCEAHIADFPRRAKGEIRVNVEGDDIPVPITLTSEAAPTNTDDAEEVCQLTLLVVTQSDQADVCGEAFRGVLDYDAEEGGWVGSLRQWSESDRAYVRNGTKMDVIYTMRPDGRVSVWNKMVESTQPLCEDRVITGEISP